MRPIRQRCQARAQADRQDKVDLISSRRSCGDGHHRRRCGLKTPQIALSPVGAAAAKNAWVFRFRSRQHHDGRGRRQHEGERRQDGSVTSASRIRGALRVGRTCRIWKPTESSWSPTALCPPRHQRRRSGAGLVAANPDAIVVGGSETPARFLRSPHRARIQGKIYHNHGVINKDFLRVGGKASKGLRADRPGDGRRTAA